MIELRVVQAGQQMNRARTGRRDAAAHFARELRVCAGHERGHLLVAYLHEIDGVTRAIERAEDPVDAVARVSVNAAHAPRGYALDEEVAGGLAHLHWRRKKTAACFA